ncbi:MAG: hypothetical protein A2131_02120 [Candidatus Sungbacteria bacterium GWC2_49_10]|uniref:Ribulose-phosphate 3-epimerase n=1 Tax=Candidatus Sungbacteria bacterium GWC2_49_10 TaxID=1802263 RepID=A0A1G2K3Z3_9BACT|nr:MAG: hypothetical protein A2131_02120 [Candidatus Sungbacteria bacterium GWC2_49_10]
MTEIIPSINVKTFEEVEERIARVEPYVKWCHLDVTDGIFSSHETWRNPKDLLDLETNLNIEVHLMVSNPDEVIDDWLIPPIKRIIVHTEVIRNFELMREKCRDRGIEIGIAINPETPVEAFDPYVGKADVFLFLTVPPGPSGNPMHPNTVGKIASFRKYCPECIIEVDGGVNPHTYEKAVFAGADILVAGAFIFDSKDIPSAIDELKR